VCHRLVGVLALVALPALAGAAELERFLAEVPASQLVAEADAYGEPAGDPPVAPVLAAGEAIGHVFLNSDHVSSVGYSGRPIHILVALDGDGVIRGAKLVEHHEPIVLVGIPEARMVEVTDGYVGVDVTELVGPAREDRGIDIVSGATVTVMVMDDSILRSAIKVARRLGLGGLQAPVVDDGAEPARLRTDIDERLDWIDLVASGSVARLKITVAEINAAFAASGDPEAAARPEDGPPGDAFVDMYAALVSVPSIGRSVLGGHEHRNLVEALEPGQHAIALAGRGSFSFKGSATCAVDCSIGFS